MTEPVEDEVRQQVKGRPFFLVAGLLGAFGLFKDNLWNNPPSWTGTIEPYLGAAIAALCLFGLVTNWDRYKHLFH